MTTFWMLFVILYSLIEGFELKVRKRMNMRKGGKKKQDSALLLLINIGNYEQDKRNKRRED